MTIDKIIKSSRRTISLEIKEDGSLVVRAPRFVLKSTIQRFVNEKESWIRKKQNLIRERNKKMKDMPVLDENKIKEYKKKAKKIISQRVEYYAEKFDFKYGKIKINSAKKRWGSCSAINNLNFSWKLVITPLYVLDYVVVHELCHTKEKNHSSLFWVLVLKKYPEYKKAKRYLKENSFLLSY